jgi:hypothetical protein
MVPRAPDTIEMCGWCKRIELEGGHWVELEQAIGAWQSFDTQEFPQVNHGICPTCLAAMRREIDATFGT